MRSGAAILQPLDRWSRPRRADVPAPGKRLRPRWYRLLLPSARRRRSALLLRLPGHCRHRNRGPRARLPRPDRLIGPWRRRSEQPADVAADHERRSLGREQAYIAAEHQLPTQVVDEPADLDEAVAAGTSARNSINLKFP